MMRFGDQRRTGYILAYPSRLRQRTASQKTRDEHSRRRESTWRRVRAASGNTPPNKSCTRYSATLEAVSTKGGVVMRVVAATVFALASSILCPTVTIAAPTPAGNFCEDTYRFHLVSLKLYLRARILPPAEARGINAQADIWGGKAWIDPKTGQEFKGESYDVNTCDHKTLQLVNASNTLSDLVGNPEYASDMGSLRSCILRMAESIYATGRFQKSSGAACGAVLSKTSSVR